MDSHYENGRTRFDGDSHRAYIGGLWDELGALQLSFMTGRGLKPGHRLLDVGCGSLRGGVRFIEYLDPFHYHGTDINGTLIRAGLERELTPELRARVSEENFIVSPDFRCDFNVEGFDYGIALSLFTHLSQNKIRLCLSRLRDKFRGGQFYATVFVSDNRDFSASQEQKGGIVTWHYKDPFHYTVPQLEAMAAETGWEFEWIGNFDHPRNQQMALFY